MENQNHIKSRRKRKVCQYCVDKLDRLDYKVLEKFKRYVTDRGKIVPRRNSGVCAKHQRMLALSIKRARYIGLIPYCVD